ncbi:hypothetical protein [Actinomadura sp. 21ATH]|uniref:hypothetical protein n=1 Tax=Actinomadura sp. 21ATH TaxID=1735444 RepID=UPI0035C0F539
MVLLIASVTAAVLLTGVGGQIMERIKYAICVTANVGDESKCESPEDLAMRPACTTNLNYDSYSGTVEVLIFDVGRDYSFMRTTTIDPQTGERKIRITAIKGGSAGVGTGLGVGVNAGNLFNAGIDASADARVRLGIGDAWEFTGPNADAEADAFEADIREQYGIDAVKENGGVLGWLGGSVYDAVAGPDIPDPHINRYEAELDLSASLTAGLGVGPPDPTGRHRAPDRHTEYEGRHRRPTTQDRLPDSRGSDSISPNASAWVGVDGNEKVVIEENERSGDTTVTLMLKGEVNYGEQHVVDGNQGQRTAMGALSMTTDRNGRLTKITLAQTHIVDGRATVVTTEVPITTDQQRADAAEYLLNPLESGGPQGQTLALTWDDMAPTEDPGPDAHPFLRQIFQNGRTSRVDYDYDQNDENYGASVKLGLKLGANFGISNSSRDVRSAEYLGAPTADGRRIYKELDECR